MKEIIIRGEKQNLTFDECLKNFKGLKGLFCNKYKNIKIEREDLEQEIDIMLFKAYELYDINTKYEFMTLAYSMIDKKLFRLNRDLFREKRKVNLFTESLNICHGKEKNIEIITLLEDKKSDFTKVIFIKEAIKKLNNKERQVASMIASGYTQNEIAEVMGCSQVQVSRIKQRILKGLKEVC